MTKSEHIMHELDAIGATLTLDGAVYTIRRGQEVIRTSDLSTINRANILNLTGRYKLERPTIYSKHA